MREIAKFSGCFVCGEKNDIGLKARFFWDQESRRAVTDITAEDIYAGYKGIFHGGIIATLLDEIMIKAVIAGGSTVVTAEMTVRFRRPVYSGDKLHFEGWEVGRKGKVYLTEGKAVNQNNIVVAEASGKYVEPNPELSQRLGESLE